MPALWTDIPHNVLRQKTPRLIRGDGMQLARTSVAYFTSPTVLQFLVDTDTQVSIISHSPTDRHTLHTNITLEAVNGTTIRPSQLTH